MMKKKQENITRAEHLEPDVIVADQEGKHSKHIFAKIMCLIAAVCVWLYVMNLERTDYERTFTQVPVIVDGVASLNASCDMSVISGYDNTVDVTVSGKKSEVQAMTAENIRVSVDVSALREAGKFNMPVKIQLPSNILSVNEEDLVAEVYVDVNATREVPVRILSLDYIISSSYTLGEPVLSLETVTVTGPGQVLDLIDCAGLSFTLGSVTTSTTMVGTPSLVDTDGVKISNPYIRCDVSEITVDIPVETTKLIKLVADYASPELLDDWAAEITPQSIMVKGDPMTLATLTEIVVYTIDKDVKEGEYVVSSIDLPDGVTSEGKTGSIYVRIRHSVG